MEVQKRVRRFLALHSLLLYAASPTAPSPAVAAAPCPFPSPASAPSRAASSASSPSTRAASSCATRTPSTSSSTPSPASSTLASPRAPHPPSASRRRLSSPRSPPPSSASASSSSSCPRTTASASSAATSASSTTSPTPSSYPTPLSSASPPISSSSSCPPPPTSPLPPSSAPESATIASTAPPAPARRTRASRSPSASRRDLRSASTSALQFGGGSASPTSPRTRTSRATTCARLRCMRAVAAVHELLSLTVEKRTTLERLVLFRGALGVPEKIKEFLLKYQGIFYISKPGHTVFLREAYYKGELVEPNEIYMARRKLEEVLMMSPQKANLARMFTSMGRGWDELGGGRRGGAELREEFLGDAGGRKEKVGAHGDDGADSGEDSGVESLYIE